MKELLLRIGGRQYRVACAPGQEQRIVGLGRVIDERLQSLGLTLLQNDAKHLLLASLVLADELESATAQTKPAADAEYADLVAERDALRAERDRLAETVSSLQREDDQQTLTFGTMPGRASERQGMELADALERIAESLEQSADALENDSPPSPAS